MRSVCFLGYLFGNFEEIKTSSSDCQICTLQRVYVVLFYRAFLNKYRAIVPHSSYPVASVYFTQFVCFHVRTGTRAQRFSLRHYVNIRYLSCVRVTRKSRALREF